LAEDTAWGVVYGIYKSAAKGRCMYHGNPTPRPPIRSGCFL